MGWVVKATPWPLYPRERTGTHFIGVWVGPRPGLDGYEKSRFPPEFDRRTVQALASRYADWAIAAHEYTYYTPNKSQSFFLALCKTFKVLSYTKAVLITNKKTGNVLWRNIETRSWNHCYRGKAYKCYLFCMSVTLFLQHAMRTCSILPPSVTRQALSYFFEIRYWTKNVSLDFVYNFRLKHFPF
jgi:hypothetical protein